MWKYKYLNFGELDRRCGVIKNIGPNHDTIYMLGVDPVEFLTKVAGVAMEEVRKDNWGWITTTTVARGNNGN